MTPIRQTSLTIKPILVLLGLASFWGANMAVVKIGSREISPVFMAALRSMGAGVCLVAYMHIKKMPIFPKGIMILHGLVIGTVFAIDFALLYVGLKYTYASRGYVILYIAPFVTAIGAHFFLDGDRLHLKKVAGLCLAFSGIVTLFSRDLGNFNSSTLPGDVMIMLSGIGWGSMTVYIKKFMTEKVSAFQILFLQVFFSLPILLGLSFFLEDVKFSNLSWIGISSVFYQSVIIVFITYLVWTILLTRYPASLVHAFSFFTPILGVFISGVLILNESIGLSLIIALAMVCFGLVLVNQPAKSRSPSIG